MADDKKSDGELKAVWFAAGMAALMACLEQFIFYTHWRVWVFLALNLLLLAILFTSSNQIEDEDEMNKKSQKCRPLVSKIGTQCANNLAKREGLCLKIAAQDKDEDDEDGKEGSFELSKEELNERVEAFIKMFRQQYLVSDAKSMSCRRSDNFSAKHLLVNSSNVYI